MKKSSELNIDLYAKNIWGETAFNVACSNGRLKVWVKKVDRCFFLYLKNDESYDNSTEAKV